tara:strand:+ start:43 stop:678 length:636 start_codon:yes stop_codon:yes gene_type:complete
MGAASSGGSDNQVSGAEAVATGGTTYSSRQTKTVNKSIAEQNRKNRDSRKSLPQKLFEASLIGKATKAISNSKFIKDSNYKKRIAFAKKSGKFTNTDLTSREFVLSSGFKNQLDELGYSNEPGNVGGNDNANNSRMIKKNIGGKIISVAPTAAEVSQSEAANATNTVEEDSIYSKKKKIKAKGRSATILTSSKGITTDDTLTLGKKSLLGS